MGTAPWLQQQHQLTMAHVHARRVGGPAQALPRPLKGSLHAGLESEGISSQRSGPGVAWEECLCAQHTPRKVVARRAPAARILQTGWWSAWLRTATLTNAPCQPTCSLTRAVSSSPLRPTCGARSMTGTIRTPFPAAARAGNARL